MNEDGRSAAERNRCGLPQEAYCSEVISISSLMRKVEKRLKEKYPESSIDLPSERWVAMQFMPRDYKGNTACQYTGRYELKSKIQQRTLRYPHEDDHYGNALLKYGRQFAMRHRMNVIAVCTDEKARIQLRPPSIPQHTGVRNRRSLAPCDRTLIAADHDFDGSYLTPSVYLVQDVPENPGSGSWYTGSVHVCLKDAVFQRSEPLRHAAELYHLLMESCGEHMDKSVVLLTTDGGPDRNLQFVSLQASHIALFLKIDLDVLYVLRTIPKQSYRNPVERCMSLLNLTLYNVALARDSMENAEFEQQLKATNSMADLRELSNRLPGFQSAFTKSLESCIDLINNRFRQLVWTGSPSNS